MMLFAAKQHRGGGASREDGCGNLRRQAPSCEVLTLQFIAAERAENKDVPALGMFGSELVNVPLPTLYE